MIGNQRCVYNAQSLYLQCAIAPDGDCEDCEHFSPRGKYDPVLHMYVQEPIEKDKGDGVGSVFLLVIVLVVVLNLLNQWTQSGTIAPAVAKFKQRSNTRLLAVSEEGEA
jgi:hypothetical protein